MRFSGSVLLAIAALVSSTASQQVVPPVLGTDPFTGLNLPRNAFGATVLAYIYSSPLLPWANLAGNVDSFGVNVIRGGQSLPGTTPGTTLNKRTNVDTLYGKALLDLTSEDLILHIPPLQQDRYVSYSFFDPYSDDFAVISTVTNDASGDYLIRPTLMTGRGGKSNINCTGMGLAGCIDSPVSTLFLIVRVLADPNNQSDIQYVSNFIHSSTIKSTNAHDPTAKPLSGEDFANLSSDNVTRAFQLAARFSDRAPPQDTKLATFVPFTLLAAGIENGSFTPVDGVDLGQVDQTLRDITQAFAANRQNVLQLSNGWTSSAPFWSGGFQGGANLVARAYEAIGGYAQNTAQQSIYPLPQNATYTLGDDEALLITFSAKPPILKQGFWSLTLYKPASPQLFTVPQDKHEVGDRSDLRYPDGTRVYGGKNTKRNSPFTIIVQPYNKIPPKNMTGNFLPAPINSTAFRLEMRFYAPILDQTATLNPPYIYPKIVRHAAITG